MQSDVGKKQFQTFLGLGLTLAVFLFIYLVLLPGDPKNAWILGLSRSRMILATMALLMVVSFLIVLAAARRNDPTYVGLIEKLTLLIMQPANFWTAMVVLIGIVLGGAVGFAYAWASRNDLQAAAYILRLGPFVIWGWGVAVYGIVAIWSSLGMSQLAHRAILFSDTRFHDRVMILLIFLFSAGKSMWGELISIGRGFGWDGGIYGDVAMDFYKEVFVNQLFEFNFQRILPSAIVHYGLRLMGSELNRDSAILGFQTLNIIALVVGLFVWGKIADELRLNIRTRWLAFIGLYLNYAFLKQMFFYPVLTDALAFTLGILALYCYLKKWRWGLLLLVVVAGFTWPLMVIGLLILLAFPRQDTVPFSVPGRLNLWSALGLSLIWLSAVYFYQFIEGRYPEFGLPIYKPALWLSIPLGLAYVFWLFYFALDEKSLFSPRTYFQQINWTSVLLGIMAFMGLRWIVMTFSLPGGLGNSWYFTRLSLDTVNRPLIFLLAHVVYFGPFVLLTVFVFKRFVGCMHRFGLGMSLFMLMHLVLTLDSETRHLVNVMPFFVAFTALAANDLQWPHKYYWGLAVLAIITSKAYIRFGPLTGIEYDFPRQWYFMNHGPWINQAMYLVQGAVVLGMAGGIYWMLRIKKSTRIAHP